MHDHELTSAKRNEDSMHAFIIEFCAGSNKELSDKNNLKSDLA